VADSVAVMVNGRIAAVLPASQLLEDEALQSRYLGIARSHHH
jgi:ABC-type branched-subunit amino acid transport system ATPase component